MFAIQQICTVMTNVVAFAVVAIAVVVANAVLN